MQLLQRRVEQVENVLEIDQRNRGRLLRNFRKQTRFGQLLNRTNKRSQEVQCDRKADIMMNLGWIKTVGLASQCFQFHWPIAFAEKLNKIVGLLSGGVE